MCIHHSYCVSYFLIVCPTPLLCILHCHCASYILTVLASEHTRPCYVQSSGIMLWHRWCCEIVQQCQVVAACVHAMCQVTCLLQPRPLQLLLGRCHPTYVADLWHPQQPLCCLHVHYLSLLHGHSLRWLRRHLWFPSRLLWKDKI